MIQMENRSKIMTDELIIRARQNCCRLCLAPDSECVPIFTNSAADKEPLFTKIIACVGIKVSRTDRLSCRICHACISYLNSWQSFKNRCVASQLKQQNWLEMASSKSSKQSFGSKTGLSSLTITSTSTNGSTKYQKSNYQSHLPFSIKSEAEDKYGKYDESENVDPRSLLPRDVEITLEERRSLSPPQPASSGSAPNILASLGLQSVHSNINPYSFLSTELSENYDSRENTADDSVSIIDGGYETSGGMPCCRVCKMQFSTRANARRHERNIHGRESITPTPQPVKPPSTRITPEMMGIYDYTNPSKYRHLLTDAKILFLRRNEEFLKQYQNMTCKCCDKDYSTYKIFMAHMRKKYPSLARNLCFKCLKQFQSKPLFVAHLKKKNCINLYKIFLNDESIPKSGPLFASPDKMGAKELLANKLYECKLCSKTYRLKLDFRTHVNEEHVEDMQKKEQSPGICVFCGMTITDPIVRKRHYGNHECIVILHCGTCKATFENNQQFIEHVYSSHLPPPTTETGRASNDASAEGTDVTASPSIMDSSSHSLRYPQSCKICGQKYNNYYNVLRHMEAKHPDQLPKTYNCEKCDTGFARQSSLREHMYDVHGTTLPRTVKRESYSCRLCSEVFEHPLKWVSHQSERHSKYVCCQCDYQTENIDEFKNHLETHPTMACALGLNVPTQYDTGTNGDVKFHLSMVENHEPSHKRMRLEDGINSSECHVCHGIFDNKQELANHIKTHNNPSSQRLQIAQERLVNVRPLNIKKPVGASIVDSRFRRMRCRICQKRFSTKKGYRRHMFIDHQVRNVQFIKCGVCNAEFTHEKGLKVHMFKIHQTVLTNESMEVQFECEVCGTVYRTEDQLQAHKNSVHGIHPDDVITVSSLPQTSANPTNEKALWFQCRYCPSNFDSNKKLAIHVNSHDEFDSKDYSCKDCGNVYSGRKSLWVHRYKKHPMIPDPAECKICIKTFFDKNMLFLHLKTHSPADVYEQLQKLKENMKQEVDKDSSTFSALNVSRRGRLSLVGDENGNEPPEEASDDLVIEHVACSMCGEKFNDQDLFDKHMQMHEMELYSDNPLASMFDTGPDEPKQLVDAEVEEHGCDLCDKTFATSSALKAHRNWHFRSDAKQTSSEPPELRTINRKKPVNVMLPILCHFCNSTFSKRSNLRRHIITLHKHEMDKRDDEHGSDVLYFCQKCPDEQSYESYGEFIEHKIDHVKQCNAGDNTKWDCDICGNVFPSQDNLIQHMKSHLKDDGTNGSIVSAEHNSSEIGSESNSNDSVLTPATTPEKQQPISAEPEIEPKKEIPEVRNNQKINETFNEVKEEINKEIGEDIVDLKEDEDEEDNKSEVSESQDETDEDEEIDDDDLTDEDESNEEDVDTEGDDLHPDEAETDAVSVSSTLSKSHREHSATPEESVPKPTGSYVCTLCQLFFNTSQELRYHVTSRHF